MSPHGGMGARPNKGVQFSLVFVADTTNNVGGIFFGPDMDGVTICAAPGFPRACVSRACLSRAQFEICNQKSHNGDSDSNQRGLAMRSRFKKVQRRPKAQAGPRQRSIREGVACLGQKATPRHWGGIVGIPAFVCHSVWIGSPIDG